MSNDAEHTNNHSIEGAIDVLEQNLSSIKNVTEWAEMMEYSRSYFSSRVKECFGNTPFQIMLNMRMRKICKHILTHPRKQVIRLHKW